MARHRSPQGRRAHLGPPLFAVSAAAGVGGVRWSIPLPQLTSSLPVRFVATAVVGGALAAAGQQALAEAIPMAGDGANVLRLGVEELWGTATPATAFTSAPTAAPAVAPIVAEPLVADATELVKAAELQRLAAEAAEQARVAEAARAADAARVAETAPAAVAAGGVQMIVGRVTSGFGARWGSSHQGLDIAAPIGTPIRAPLGGVVVDSGPASGFGLWVRVKHADGTITVYGHINRSLVSKGEKVTAGQMIAEVGNRGHSTGPHLHIEVITPGGTKINPRPWLDERGIGYN